ncbi:Phosphoribosylformylglycinamidine cyclo-ligase [Pseudobythopirellula maris]|uniref:Phosphoribosylformylglycinamidine cyclo-ligase n=1 Tax=Pseudobythopirellula maris TaxID=2527991 RepID=A0A5C5ZUI2_9BACT|nr:phosphoribosylformylglycinamidine cyclo-ligase [Pseudobythopirellula maris]TWT90775.1 Phosphoribosylformylglycinamidine cyclo-ligase [Pseudobythopirellula maris]
MAKATYKDAGVDLDVYQQSMSRLPRLMRRTHTPRVMPLEGGFAGLFQLDFAGKLFARNYRNPVMVACTDGVGTKLKVAQLAGRHDTVGIDLVAMCANDALCCGAEPLFFLDYVAMGRDDPDRLEQIVAGISEGCVQADSALIGGETAIMPDLYGVDDYDLAGFSVGVVERDRLIDGSKIGPGDVVLGVESSGLHSNGFSLARKVVFELAGLTGDDTVEECGGATVADLLLEPTRIYVRPMAKLLAHYRRKQVVHGVAHITGGGLRENLERILPPGAKLRLDDDSWPVPPVFRWIQRLGDVEPAEMARVFNMGLGLALVVSEHFADSLGKQLADQGLASWQVGRIEQR